MKKSPDCNLVLPFEFWEEEKEREEKEWRLKIERLPYYPEPKNDQEMLFNLQRKYYMGDQEALKQLFSVLLKISPKQVNIEMRSSKGRRRFSQDKIDEIALDAVGLFIEQIIRNRLIITTSFISYLRLQVKKVINTQTKAQKFEKFCVKNHIPIFDLSEEEKKIIKKQFEMQLERK